MNPEDFVDIPQECCLTDERVLVAFYDRMRKSSKKPDWEYRTRWSVYSDGWIIRMDHAKAPGGDWEPTLSEPIPERRIKSGRALQGVLDYVREHTDWSVTIADAERVTKPRG